MKNVVKLEHYHFPGELRKQLTAFVHHYNHKRYHESLNNVTPADVYYGRAQAILDKRAVIKKTTMQRRRRQSFASA